MAKLLRKVYSRIFWKNEDESKTTPLGKSNLNKEDEALEIIDQRVCDLSNDKAEISEVQDSIIYYDIEPISGNITVRTRGGGEKIFYIYQLIPRLAAVKAEADRAEHMADVATEYGNKAIASANAAAISEANSKVSETNAKTSEVNAKNSENLVVPVKPIAEEAIESAKNIREVEANVEAMVDKLIDEISGTFVGALTAKGTIPFESLPTTDNQSGDMYNISNNFTSDDRFVDGAGKEYKAGSNVYWTMDGKWDVLAAPVSAKVLETLGQVAAVTNDQRPANRGLTFSQAYNNGYPGNFGAVITTREANTFGYGADHDGCTQLFISWAENERGVWYRSIQDLPDRKWTDWVRLIDSTTNNQRILGNIILPYLKLNDGVNDVIVLTAFDDADGSLNYGSEIVLGGHGNTFIGGGEAATNLRNALINGNPPHPLDYTRNGENIFIAADGVVHLIAGYQTPTANNMTCVYLNNMEFSPIPQHIIRLGGGDRRWQSVWTNAINDFYTPDLTNSSSLPYWKRIPVVDGVGLMEIGKYIDFHNDNTETDFTLRLYTETFPDQGEHRLTMVSSNKTSQFIVKSEYSDGLSRIGSWNPALNQYMTMQIDSFDRGLWDVHVGYWCFLDNNNKAYFKGTADKAFLNAEGQSLSRNLEIMEYGYIYGTEGHFGVEDNGLAAGYMIFLKAISSNNSIYGVGASIWYFNSTGEISGGNMYASTNTPWKTSGNNGELIITPTSSTRTLFCAIYRVNGWLGI